MHSGKLCFGVSERLYKKSLSLNYRLITPLLSKMSPAAAYSLNRITGSIGKPLRYHTTCLNDFPAAPHGVESLMTHLKVDTATAEGIVRKIFLYETRLELENRWLAGNKIDRISHIIDLTLLQKVAERILEKGPMLILSAHTFNYIMMLWALHTLGVKISFMMIDPRSGPIANKVLGQSLIRCVDDLLKIMPLIFTNEGNAVRKSIELLEKGYTVLMLPDVPDYRDKGIQVSMLNDKFWIPFGCQAIFKKAQPFSVISVLSYAERLDKPYRVVLSSLETPSGIINMQRWANSLDRIVRFSPESWYGWFYSKRMQ